MAESHPNNPFDYYRGRGDGNTLQRRRGIELPPYTKPKGLNDPAGYRADKGLAEAVNVALLLGRPLLLTGEPGTGKTQLAYSIAYELGLGEPLVFNAKTTSTATDLFYHFDALLRFHDSTTGTLQPIDHYIDYVALGLAILLAMEPQDSKPFLPEGYTHDEPRRSVVLIDEIDKAPRDLANDVLNEIDDMKFMVKERDRHFFFSAPEKYRPIVIMTSNSEKDLPEAFLRRCVFFHITFPDETALHEILDKRLNGSWLLAADDLKDVRGLLQKLRTAHDPVSQFLQSNLPPDLTRLLQKEEEELPLDEWQWPLIEALNSLLRGESLFEESRFAQIKLSAETKVMLSQLSQGASLLRLNRSLLEDAYPGELVKSQSSGLFVSEELIAAAVKHFRKIRALPLKKKPATAELINWVLILQRQDLSSQDLTNTVAALIPTYTALLKDKDDRRLVLRDIHKVTEESHGG